MYTGLLAAYAADHELKRWTGRADRYALAAESVIYAWWLAFLAMLLWVNLRCGCTRVLPGDMAAICKQVIVVFFGSGVSKYFHAKGGVRETVV
jgi:ascorbate-specific PTS system EIIC-type component UlaA